MKLKKYIINPNSEFNKSIILSLFEHGDLSFNIVGFTDEDRKDVFPYSPNIKNVKNEIDIKSIPSKCVVVYLDEELILKALVVQSKSNKFYLFKVDHQNDNQLNIHQKYISSDLSSLLVDYEKHCKNKGKSYYEGEGDFSLIADSNYFEDIYKKEIKKQINKESSIYRLTFLSNNMFTTDFVNLIEKKEISIININQLDKKIFTLSSMQKNKNDRKDCLLIDSTSKDIKYFIFTYKPYLVKHYLLLKNLGDNKFLFLKESLSFNALFINTELKDITFRNGSALAVKSFAKMRYDNFYLEYIAFEAEEEFDEEIQNELESVVDVFEIKRKELLQEVISIINDNHMALDIGITYHGKERILERIGNMSEIEMLSLSKVAYEKGLTSGHYIEKDPLMFKFLSYQQNKKIGKTLRFYKDILFFYTLEPPHMLVTCFLYKNNFELFTKEDRKNTKRK